MQSKALWVVIGILATISAAACIAAAAAAAKGNNRAAVLIGEVQIAEETIVDQDNTQVLRIALTIPAQSVDGMMTVQCRWKNRSSLRQSVGFRKSDEPQTLHLVFTMQCMAPMRVTPPDPPADPPRVLIFSIQMATPVGKSFYADAQAVGRETRLSDHANITLPPAEAIGIREPIRLGDYGDDPILISFQPDVPE